MNGYKNVRPIIRRNGRRQEIDENSFRCKKPLEFFRNGGVDFDFRIPSAGRASVIPESLLFFRSILIVQMTDLYTHAGRSIRPFPIAKPVKLAQSWRIFFAFPIWRRSRDRLIIKEPCSNDSECHEDNQKNDRQYRLF